MVTWTPNAGLSDTSCRIQVSVHDELFAPVTATRDIYFVDPLFFNTDPTTLHVPIPKMYSQYYGSFLAGSAQLSDTGLTFYYNTYNAIESYAGYYFLLYADVSGHNVLQFLVRGNGGEAARVGLRDTQHREVKIPIGEYLPGGITSALRLVTIPLASFAGVDLSSLENVHFDADHTANSGNGQLFVDKIRFNTIVQPPPVVVDNFDIQYSLLVDGGEARYGFDGRGGRVWTCHGGDGVIQTAYDTSHRVGDMGTGYRIDFSNINETNWAVVVWDLRELDARSSNILAFDVMGSHGGERPHVYLKSTDGSLETQAFMLIDSYGTVVGTTWTHVEIPLYEFAAQGVDLSHLVSLSLAFEWDHMEGSIFVDNIMLEK